MKKYVILALMIIGLMIINGCAHNQVIEADKEMVKNCMFIGITSDTFNNPSEGRKFALDQAAKKGATHVILKITPEGKKRPGKYLVNTKFYKCSESNNSSPQ